MKRLVRYSSLLLLSLHLTACSTDAMLNPDEAFRYALEYELDNRATAIGVVPRLAERHEGSPRGAFWDAYADLERLNRERYAPVAGRHGLTGGGWRIWLKIQGSLAAEKFFPDRFVQGLANATRDYMKDLEAVPMPSAAADRQFLRYIRAQEAAQVAALAHAANQRFQAGEEVLRDFLENAEQETKSAPSGR